LRFSLLSLTPSASLSLGTSLSEGGKNKRREAFVPVPVRKIFFFENFSAVKPRLLLVVGKE
jgi:hypothetical protein